jgi:glycosyltransferase involved in cell wall biosynthesis
MGGTFTLQPLTSVFFAYRDSAERRRALASPLGSPERYLLFGLDELRARGLGVGHNLGPGRPPSRARAKGAALKWLLERLGGYGGDFATVLASRGSANRADLVLSTVDTVGIPLMLLKRLGLIRPPLVYVAIGLPERLERLRSRWMRKFYASALGSCVSVVAYSEHEADVLRDWLGRHDAETPVEFVPFGVDTERFRPEGGGRADDVVSVGADPHRDFALLLEAAARMPERSFRIVTTADHLGALATIPGNVVLETNLPFDEMRERLAGARVVALPVRENSYSGATTVLLQAMALGKPVVVTRTQAIAAGYGLVDGENCRLVPPGDGNAFERALADLLRDGERGEALGKAARATVERDLSWDRYVGRMEEILLVAAGARPRPRSPSA